MLASLQRSAQAQVAHLPPVARTVDVVDRRFGITLPDPYRWMENAKDPEWEPFMRGQAAYARERLDAIPGRSRIAERIAKISGDLAVVYKVQRAGGRIFVEYRQAGASSFKLYVIDRPGAELRLLFDPDREIDAGRAHLSIDYWAASPDGAWLAFGASPAGSEDSVVRVLKTEDSSLLPDRLDRAQYARVAWLPDSSGFFLSRLREDARRGATDYYDNSVAWLHRLRVDPKDDRRIVGGPDVIDGYRVVSSEFPAVIVDEGSDWALLQVSGAVRRHNPIFAAPLSEVRAGTARWRLILTLADEVTNVALRGDHLYYVSEREGPNGRLFKMDLTAPRKAEAQLIAPETEHPIEPTTHGTLMVAARDGVYFVRTKGGPQVVYRVDDDDKVTALPMPFEAGVTDLFATTREDGMDAGLAGWVQPFGIWRFTPGSGRFGETLPGANPKLDLSRYESFQILATARDGTRVPVSIIARRGLKRDGSAPCLARCYAAYGISATPAFSSRFIALLEAGGVFAQVHARGGGEFGSRWWKSGQMETKPNTWRDFIDGCEALIAAGITTSQSLTIMGSSAGGIAVGRAMTERPDLFAGAIFNVAFTNPTRLQAEATGASSYEEFGDPGVEPGFKALYEMDTYQHVREGVHYPAVLVMHGMTDSRVSPWHSAKLAARLQKVNTGQRPVLLRVTFDAGHGAGSTRTQVDQQWADIIAFTLRQASTKRGRPKAQPPR